MITIAIPARMKATRLPNKPLLDIVGRPLIAHVIDCARRFDGAQIVVATDDLRIAEVAEREGVMAVLTRSEHATGSDRLAEVADRLEWTDDQIVVNLQGDEPLMPLSCLRAVVAALKEDSGAAAATLAMRIDSIAEALDPNAVKVVSDAQGRALYFSRAPIPWPRDAWRESQRVLPDGALRRHLGLYAYRAGTLRRFAALPPAPLEAIESLEQLRLLHHGLKIAVRDTPEAIPPGVDTPEDLARVRAHFVGEQKQADHRWLFMCLGNICRSPLAAAYARKCAAEQGLRVHVESAGTLSSHAGERADGGARELAAIEGVDVSQHRARQVKMEDFERFDRILAMDDRNMADLSKLCPPEHRHKLQLLLDYAPHIGRRTVPDPYGQPLSGFQRSYELIVAGVDGLVMATMK